MLYGELARMNPSAIIELNRAVAVGMADGPAAGLRSWTSSTLPLALPDTTCFRRRADMLRRLERHDEAAAAYRAAIELTSSETEQRYLERRLAECEELANMRS